MAIVHIKNSRRSEHLIELWPDYYRALKRLEKQTGISVDTAIHKAIKDFVNYYGVHITKQKD